MSVNVPSPLFRRSEFGCIPYSSRRHAPRKTRTSVKPSMIVKRAAEWGVDTTRLGMIGFSAGAGLTMHCTLNSKSMQLDFVGPIYGGMGPVEVPKNAPPMFNVIATDDFLFRGQFGVIESWFKAGRPVEFHLYQNGGYGFGLGNPDRTSNRWFDAFIHWLEVNDFLAAK